MDSRLNRVFREVFDDPGFQVQDDLSRRNLAAWDSLAHVKLIIALEEEFGIKFTIDQVANVQSVAELKTIVSSAPRG